MQREECAIISCHLKKILKDLEEKKNLITYFIIILIYSQN